MSQKILHLFIVVFLYATPFYGLDNSLELSFVDSEKTPIPYAYITFPKYNMVGMADSLGQFSVDTTVLKQGDTIIFSALGYHSVRLTFPLKTAFIELKPQVFHLRKVTATVKIGKNKKHFGYDKKRAKGSAYVKVGEKYVTFFRNRVNDGFISKVYLHLISSNRKRSVIRLLVLAQDSISKLPGGSLLEDDIIFTIEKKKNVLDVSKYQIPSLKEGFFVGFEVISTNNMTYRKKTSSGCGVYIAKGDKAQSFYGNELLGWKRFEMPEDELQEIPKIFRKMFKGMNFKIGLDISQ